MPSKKNPIASVPELPEPVTRSSVPYVLSPRGTWLILCDVHVPYHDPTTIKLAVQEAKDRKIVGVLFNGDFLDQHELSRWDKSPDDPRYVDEVNTGRQLLEWLRYELPDAKFVYKDGNHEERLLAYLCQRAPALFGLDVLTLPNILQFEKWNIEHVTDKRVIRAGKLNIVHGHEYRPGIQAPVNPARGLFLRAKANVLGGHFHQISDHQEPDILGRQQAAWSVGCACDLHPLYLPLNKWSNGFAIVDIQNGGDFKVYNHRVMDGRIF
jgi:predicted phosphodiesterase